MELRGDAGAPPSTPPPEWAFGPGVWRTRRVGVVRAGDWPIDDWWWGVGTRGAVANGTRRAPAAPPACARSRLFRRDIGRGLGICFIRRARITSVGFGRSALFSVRWIAVAFSMGCRRATVTIVGVRLVGNRFDWLDVGDGLRLGGNRRFTFASGDVVTGDANRSADGRGARGAINGGTIAGRAAATGVDATGG